MKRLVALLATTGFMASAFLVLPYHRAYAVGAADWRAGRIIDDAVFTNKNAMSVTNIQNFLNQKVGTTQANGTPGVCDTNGTKMSEFGDGTRAHYGADHGNPTPFTCLKDYYEVPKTSPGPNTPASNYGGQPIPAGAKSAAQIIWDAAQQYNISPKILLTTLQKESAGPLVTDDWPFKSQYLYAMGAHCPDSSGCDSNYAGFSIQISESAALFRYYLDNMTQPWWPYKKPGNNSILYNPNTGCGSSNVSVVTSATAALYTYTPYQPNGAALNNMYGSGDSCSAYGNRNFWRQYNDWFGSPYASYAWWPMGYQIYDQTQTNRADPGLLQPGQRYVAVLTALNVGESTWTNDGPTPINLATANPTARTSSLCDSTWLACNRPATLTDASVAPGQSGHFTFAFNAPFAVGSYREDFKPVAENLTWFGDAAPQETFGIKVVSPGSYAWSTSGYVIKDQSNQQVDPGLLQPGQHYTATLSATNTGSATWYNNGPTPMHLGSSNGQGHRSALCIAGWLACDRPATLTEASVAPGQTGHFTFGFNAPFTVGPYREDFKPLAEMFSWTNDAADETFGIKVQSPGSFTWNTSGYVIKDQSNQQVDPGHLTHGQTYTATIAATNTGSATWYNTGSLPVLLGASNPTSRSSSLCYNTWNACNRPTLLTEASVVPGQTGHFTFTFQAPNTLGAYRESFKPVAEMFAWFNDYSPYDSFGIWVTQ
jgi:hypothetical protein